MDCRGTFLSWSFLLVMTFIFVLFLFFWSKVLVIKPFRKDKRFPRTEKSSFLQSHKIDLDCTFEKAKFCNQHWRKVSLSQYFLLEIHECITVGRGTLSY